jgi:dTDP-4-dehydrorhamnose reductase
MKKKKTLLIGGSGNLGLQIIKSKIFKNIYAPRKTFLNLLNPKQINRIFEKNVGKAINNNIEGTYNLVKAILEHEKKFKKKIKLVHISSDAVYSSTKGNYKENSNLGPYNNYGWTKLSAEYLIKIIENSIIIRTRFYNKNDIKYKFSASDIFTSQIEVGLLPKYINYLLKENYSGIINVGNKKKSDFEIYKKINPKLKKFKRKDLIRKLKFKIAKDSSLNLKIFNKIKNKYE